MEIIAKRRLSANVANLRAIRRFVEEVTAPIEVLPEAVANIILAMNEAITNIIVHGYQESPGFIDVEVGRRERDLIIRLRDQAPPFDPTRLQTPDVDLPLEQRAHGRMGIPMMQKLTDQLIYQTNSLGENELTLVKHEAF